MSNGDQELTLNTGVKIIKKSYKVGQLSSGSASGSTSTSGSASTSASPRQTSPTEDIHDVSPTTETASTDPVDDAMALTAEQKEALIEKMETKKHKIKTEYRETNNQDLKSQYKEVCALLARIKECDAIDKIHDNIEDGKQLTSDFKRKFKKLAVTDFNRIIDLTGSKEGRKPDISTETWLKGRTVVFKDKVYRPPPEEKLEKFKSKMTLKPMPTEFRNAMESNRNGNLEVAHVRTNKPELIKYKQYDPLSFSGLNIY
jgi:hypothetical protein